MKAFLSPKWLGWHALLVVSLVALVRIGLWQWRVGMAEDDWKNYGYAVQWWLFAGFAVFLWVKLVLDELDPERVRPPEEKAEAAPLPQPDLRPQASPGDDEQDAALAEYNRRLAALAEQGRE